MHHQDPPHLSLLQSILPDAVRALISEHRNLSMMGALLTSSAVLVLVWRIVGNRDGSNSNGPQGKKRKRRSIFDKIETASVDSTNIGDVMKTSQKLARSGNDGDGGQQTTLEGQHMEVAVQTRFVGLRNEGATCYLNSLLQTLYHIPCFRRAVFQIPTQKNKNGIASALQGVFYNLQMANDSSVSTRNLIRSFGWSTEDAFVQHDVQELARLLLDVVDSEMRRSPVEGVVQRLFEGETKNYIRCLYVDYESASRDTFLDVQLDVKGCSNIRASFEKYIEPEILSGENQYRADHYGLQDAQKGTMFVRFPPVLMIHLKRFEYSMMGGLNKISQSFAFDDEIDLSPFVLGHGQDQIYTLHAYVTSSSV